MLSSVKAQSCLVELLTAVCDKKKDIRVLDPPIYTLELLRATL